MKRWNVEAQTELDEIVNELLPIVERLRELANKGWNEKRANVLRMAAAKLHYDVINQIVEY
jgi:hypothetical protein